MGNEFVAPVVGLSPTGDAVVKTDEKVIFVPGGIPEQTIRGRMIRKKKKVFFGETLEVLKKSPHERLPLDKHFGDFGGSPWQTIDEKEQEKWKFQFVVDAFLRIGKLEIPEIEPLLGSPQKTEYRNKMEFSFGYERMRTQTAEDGSKTHYDENPGLGFHRRGNWKEIARITESCLAKPLFFEIARIIENFALASTLPVWNPLARRGFWRNVVVRHSPNTGEILVEILVFEEKSAEFWADLVTQLREAFPEIIGILQTVHNGCSVVKSEAPTIPLLGRDFYREKLAERDFCISHNAFFQVNIPAAENLVKTISDFLNIQQHETLLDLFCGSGALGIAAGKSAKKLVGIELNANAILDARKNAEINNMKNVEFLAGDAAKILATVSQDFDAAIVDPPRAGLDKKAQSLIANLPARRIVMVSCNPATLARDLAEITPNKWKIARIRPVDLFPQTPHTETVVLLERAEEDISPEDFSEKVLGMETA